MGTWVKKYFLVLFIVCSFICGENLLADPIQGRGLIKSRTSKTNIKKNVRGNGYTNSNSCDQACQANCISQFGQAPTGKHYANLNCGLACDGTTAIVAANFSCGGTTSCGPPTPPALVQQVRYDPNSCQCQVAYPFDFNTSACGTCSKTASDCIGNRNAPDLIIPPLDPASCYCGVDPNGCSTTLCPFPKVAYAQNNCSCSCPAGTPPSYDQNTCCPVGEVNINGTCTVPCQSIAGSIFNGQNMQCECPSPLILNTQGDACVPNCTLISGSLLVGNQCQCANPLFTIIGNACSLDCSAIPGTVLQGGQCVCTQPGYVILNGVCSPPPQEALKIQFVTGSCNAIFGINYHLDNLPVANYPNIKSQYKNAGGNWTDLDTIVGSFNWNGSTHIVDISNSTNSTNTPAGNTVDLRLIDTTNGITSLVKTVTAAPYSVCPNQPTFTLPNIARECPASDKKFTATYSASNLVPGMLGNVVFEYLNGSTWTHLANANINSANISSTTVSGIVGTVPIAGTNYSIRLRETFTNVTSPNFTSVYPACVTCPQGFTLNSITNTCDDATGVSTTGTFKCDNLVARAACTQNYPLLASSVHSVFGAPATDHTSFCTCRHTQMSTGSYSTIKWIQNPPVPYYNYPGPHSCGNIGGVPGCILMNPCMDFSLIPGVCTCVNRLSPDGTTMLGSACFAPPN